MVLLPTLFPGFREALGPKHSTSLPSSAGDSVVLSVDVKEAAFVANPASGVAVKASFLPLGPQFSVEVDRCARVHRLLLYTTNSPNGGPTSIDSTSEVDDTSRTCGGSWNELSSNNT